MSAHGEAVRVLVPDHPALPGKLDRACEFSAVLRHANDPDEGHEPWRLPNQLVAAELEAAMDAVTMTDLKRTIDTGEEDGSIGVNHAGTSHMPLHVAAVTREQVDLIAEALDLLTQPKKIPFSDQLPAVREVAAFVEAVELYEEDYPDADASLAAWLTIARIVVTAVATAPAAEDRPTRMYTADAVLRPVAKGTGTSPAADTELVLSRIDASNGRSVDLDDEGFLAWRRLIIEWHTAIYGPKSNEPSSVLQSYAY